MPEGDDWISSVPELARRTGVNERTIRGWRSHPAWPFEQRGPLRVYLPGLLRWREAVIQRADAENGGGVSKTDLEREKLAEEVAFKRLRRREKEGGLVERSILDRFCGALVAWTRDRIEQWVAALPAHFADSAAVRTILEGLYDRLCEDMQQQAAHLRFDTETGRFGSAAGNGRAGVRKKSRQKVRAAKRRHRKVKRSG